MIRNDMETDVFKKPDLFQVSDNAGGELAPRFSR
jgi:hypothetical protein